MQLSLSAPLSRRDRGAPKKDEIESSSSGAGCRPRPCAPRERSGWSSRRCASARACVLGPGCVPAPAGNASPRIPKLGLHVEHSAAERGHLKGMRVEARCPPRFQGGRRHLKDAQRKGQFFAHEASTRASCVEPDARLLRGAHPSDAQNCAGHEHVQHPLIQE